MAEKQFVAALGREGQRFDETFLLVEKELRTAANGKLFIRGMFQDKTGQARMIAWEATERYYEALPRGVQFIIFHLLPFRPLARQIKGLYYAGIPRHRCFFYASSYHFGGHGNHFSCLIITWLDLQSRHANHQL